MSDPCKQHEGCTKSISKNEANIENQGKNIDRLFDFLRETNASINDFKLEVQAGFTDIKVLFEKKNNKMESKLAGIHIKLLKLLIVIAAGKGIWGPLKKLF